MIHKFRHVLLLLLIYLFLLSGGLLLINLTHPAILPNTYATLVTFMTLITLGAYLLVRIGIRRGKQEQGIWLLAGIGGKFLSYLVLILIFWSAGKNLTKDFIIAFFVLYLLLTIFLTGVLYKILKNN